MPIYSHFFTQRSLNRDIIESNSHNRIHLCLLTWLYNILYDAMIWFSTTNLSSFLVKSECQRYGLTDSWHFSAYIRSDKMSYRGWTIEFTYYVYMFVDAQSHCWLYLLGTRWKKTKRIIRVALSSAIAE